MKFVEKIKNWSEEPGNDELIVFWSFMFMMKVIVAFVWYYYDIFSKLKDLLFIPELIKMFFK